MNRLSFFLIIILSLGMAYHAQAQFWKKMFHKEPKRTYYKKTTKPSGTKTTTTTKKKKAGIEYPPTKMKSRYRVDVLMSLYLDELVVNNKPAFKDRIPERAQSGIEFYEGISIAADSLQNLGYQMDVFIHDVTGEKGNIEHLISTNRLDSSDLIIGALQTKEIPSVAHFAAAHHINFVSALSPLDGGVRNNPYFTLLQPSLKTQCEYIKSVVTNTYPGKKITLYHRTGSSNDENAYSYFIKSDSEKIFRRILCDTVPNEFYMSTIFDSNITNVIVVATLDNAFAAKLLKSLSEKFHGYRFDIYGMPSWRGMDLIRKGELDADIKVTIPSSFNFDLNTPTAKYIDRSYRKDMGSKPGELVYRGFETLFWYADLLKKYGTIYNTRTADIDKAAFTKFNVKLRADKENGVLYNENQHVYLYRYQDGSYRVE